MKILLWTTVVIALSGLGVAQAGTVTLDGSYGTSGALSGPHYQITASMGREMGNNLFQSFGTFDLSNGDSATFSGPANIQNILARVTGGSPSSIDGTIDSSIIGANLFLLNPAGVMFGAHAQVNVSGSFAVSTANYLKFSDGGIFYAQLGANDVLSSAPVSAFGFLAPTPQPITFTGTSLNMPEGTGLHVVAGDVTLDGANLYAPGGNLTIFSAASAGEVPFSLASPGTGFASATNTSFGNITMKNVSSVAIDSTSGGGSIVIRGGKIVAQDSSDITATNQSDHAGGTINILADSLSVTSDSIIESEALAGGASGNISITATGAISVESGGDISVSTQSTGAAGDADIQAQSLSIEGIGVKNPNDGSGIFSNCLAGSTGAGGRLTLNILGAVNISDTGTIAANTFSSGNAGDIHLQANSLSINGAAAPSFVTGITSDSEKKATGHGGNIIVTTTGATMILGGGGITANTFSSGNAGDVQTQAGSLTIDGSATPGMVTGITSDTEPDASGRGGDVLVTSTGAMAIRGSGEIGASTFSSAKAGEVTVQADSLTIDGSATPSDFTGIASQASAQSSNNGGDVTVTVTNALSIQNSGEISADTFSTGNAGKITVQAGSMAINGSATPNNLTGITSDSESSDTSSTGKAGSISVTVAGALSLTGSGDIDTDTQTAGNAGDVTVKAGSLTINGSATPNTFTGISSDSDAGAMGNAGDVNVTVSGAMQLIGEGRVLSNTFSTGNAGKITVQAGSLTIDDSARPNDPFLTGILSDSLANDTSSSGKAGSVTVTVTGALSLSGGGEIDTDTQTAGSAGDVTVKAGTLTINGSAAPNGSTGILSDSSSSDLSSTAASGKVTVNVAGAISLTDGGAIDTDSSTSGNAGNVFVHAGSLTINGADTPNQYTGISSDSVSSDATSLGNAGSVTVNVDGVLSITGPSSTSTSGSSIESNSYTSGNAGDVAVSANSVSLDSAYITSEADGNAGSGGKVTVSVKGLLSVTNSSSIDTDTYTPDNAGDVTVKAGSLTINDAYITSESDGVDSSTATSGKVTVTVTGLLDIANTSSIDTDTYTSGNAGDLTVKAASLTLSSNSFISSDALSSNDSAAVGNTGNAGKITVNVAGSLNVSSGGQIDGTTNTAGHGGDVTVNAGTITLNASTTPSDLTGITAQATGAGDSGNITVNATSLSLLGGGTISTSSSANGGTITLNVGTLVYLLDSQITTASAGNGGNITIDPQFVVLNHSLISANAALGQGGNITIITDNFLNSSSMITATGSTNGAIVISSPDLDLSGSLIALPAELVSEEKRLRESCARAANHEFSSLIVVGRGGTESAPDELQSDFGMRSSQ